MSDWLFKQGRRARLISWIGVDSWIDSTIHETVQHFKDRWNAATNWFARFRLAGWKRWANELGSEALTLGAAGLAFVYVLALPAFMEIDEGRWLATGQYSVKFLDRNGNEIGKRGILHSDEVPLDEIPPFLINATLATEDRRFFEHYGIDVFGTLRALFENVRANDVVQGGSTLTQQLAKNLFLTSERSLQRKIKELFLAFWLEARLTKRQILKLYLDRAYMGGGAFGVEAASRLYFGKSVRDITLAEAAMMSGLYKAPTKYAPHINLPASRARANDVLSNLVEAGFMTAGQVHEARLNPAKPVETSQPYTPDWFLDWAFEEVQRKMRGKDQYVLTARLTVDLSLQRAAEEALNAVIRQHGTSKRARSGAIVTMEPDGAVRALVGGIDYGESQFNRATSARRQPGSSFKPYVYLTALNNGYRPKTLVRDVSPRCGRWAPKNYNGSYGGGGRVTLSRALAKSLNTVAVGLSLKVGRKKVLADVKKLGIKGVRRSCSMALGDTGITVLEHTGGYATFANGGLAVKPYGVLEIRNSKGDLLYDRERDEGPARRVFPRRHVANLNTMLQQVVEAGTGKRARLEFTHAVGKTGTSSSYRDAWFMGFTGRYVTGVWIGNDNFRPTKRVTGGNLPAMTWQAFMSVAHKDLNIPRIPGLGDHPRQVEERARLAALKRSNPALASARQAQANKKRDRIMSDQTRNALKAITAAFVKAGAAQPKKPEDETSDDAAPPGTPQRDARRPGPTTVQEGPRLATASSPR
ncbi:MAG: PBP1A family penicillin-binding protein [Pseudomonadota bacterium]